MTCKTGTYKKEANWDDLMELRVLLIFKKCHAENFPRGMISCLCKKLEQNSDTPPYTSLTAKVGNFKSLAGINNKSNWSKNSERLYKQYKDHSIADLEEVIARYPNQDICHHPSDTE